MEQKEQITAYMEYLKESERSQNTIANYLSSINDFFRRYKELTKTNIIDFKCALLAEGKKPKTVHNRCVGINQFCRFSGKPEMCVKTVKVHQPTAVENVITLEEYKRLLNCLKEDGESKGYWTVKFLAKTGARVSEFTRLDKTGLQKGYCEMWTKGKIRRIYIPAGLIEESREYFEKVPGNLLFPSRCGQEMTSRGVASRLTLMAKKYNIRKEVMHPHSFRHLYAIEFLKRNQNLSLLADLMGHSSVQTTSIYLRLSREEQMRQFNEAARW